MHLTSWFRKHERLLLSVVVVMLMISFGVLGTIQGLVGRSAQNFGTIRGDVVEVGDMEGALITLRAARLLNMTEPQMLSYLQFVDVPAGVTNVLATLSSEFRRFVFGEHPEVSQESGWRYLVLLREAEYAGIGATPAEAGEIISALPAFQGQDGFNRSALQAFLASSGMSENSLTVAVTDLARIAKLIAMRREAAMSSTAEAWAAYAFANEKMRARYVELDGSSFKPLVEVPDADVREFYEAHKEEMPSEAEGSFGYMAPERVRIEYATVRAEGLVDDVEVTDEEIAEYYEDNKFEFMAPLDEQPGTDTAASTEDDAEETRYRALEEVREEIRTKLALQKGKVKATEVAEELVAELREMEDRYANQPLPLGQTARRNGLPYRAATTDEGQRLLSRDEVVALVPAGSEVAAFAFEQEWSTYYPSVFEDEDGSYVVQVLEKRSPEPRSFDEAKAQVREDLVTIRAFERAREFAEQVAEEARRTGLAAAAQDLGGRFQAMLGEDGAEKPALEVRESEAFARSDRSLPGVDARLPSVVEDAFAAREGDVIVAAQAPPASLCYVLQPFDRQHAGPAEFSENGAQFAVYYGMQKRMLELQNWFDGLLAKATRAKQAAE